MVAGETFQSSGSQPGGDFAPPPRRYLLMSGDVFWLSQLCGKCYWHLMGAAKQPTMPMHGSDPTAKDAPDPKSEGQWSRNPVLEIREVEERLSAGCSSSCNACYCNNVSHPTPNTHTHILCVPSPI